MHKTKVAKLDSYKENVYLWKNEPFLYHNAKQSHRCSAIFLFNLAEPDWISIPCNKKIIISHLFCYVNNTQVTFHKNHNKNVKNIKDPLICSPNDIIIQGICHVFIWVNKKNSTRNICKHSISLKIETITSLRQLFIPLSVKNQMPSILIEKDVNTVYEVKFQRYLKKLKYRYKTVPISKTRGFVPCNYKKYDIKIGLNLIQCFKGGHVLSTNICDGIIDCPNDKGDEGNCISHTAGTRIICNNIHFEPKKTVCPVLYYMTYDEKCHKFINTSQSSYYNGNVNTKGNRESLTCKEGKNISKMLVDDLIFDCGLEGKDEPKLMSLLVNETYSTCEQPNMIPCMEGHSLCYHLREICSYQLNIHNHLFPCRNGGHLQQCKDFECNLMFKCISSYCIPWAYVCDGKWDCPTGDDEHNNPVCNNASICMFMFKCRHTLHTCLHLGNVCDGNHDCPLGDDKFLCYLKDVQCPLMCNCLLLAIDCSNVLDISIESEISSIFVSVSLSFNNIYSVKNLKKNLENAIIVKLSHNLLEEICYPFPFIKMVHLDLAFNYIHQLHKNCLVSLYLLQVLHINDNYVTFIQTSTFYNLSNLKFLNISNNPLVNLPEVFLKHSLEMKLLHIVNITLEKIHIDALSGMGINVIITTNYHICCIVLYETLCPTYKPWYISCSDLLPKDRMKVSFVLVSIFIFFLNFTSVYVHSFSIISNWAFSSIIISVNLNDMLYGIYLTFIWVADIFLADNFIVKEQWWRSSPLCLTAFGTILLYKLFTQFILIFLSLSRLMIVIHPINTLFKRLSFVVKSVVLGYTIFVLSVLLVVFTFKQRNIALPMSLCLPFIDPTGSIQMIKAITWLVIISETTTSAIIIIMHTLFVRKLRYSGEYVRTSKLDKWCSNSIIFLLITITMSNILCWFPANGIYIAAMFLSAYPTDLIIWTTVVVLPINSLINPLFFIITASRKYIKSRNKSKRSINFT